MRIKRIKPNFKFLTLTLYLYFSASQNYVFVSTLTIGWDHHKWITMFPKPKSALAHRKLILVSQCGIYVYTHCTHEHISMWCFQTQICAHIQRQLSLKVYTRNSDKLLEHGDRRVGWKRAFSTFTFLYVFLTQNQYIII